MLQDRTNMIGSGQVLKRSTSYCLRSPAIGPLKFFCIIIKCKYPSISFISLVLNARHKKFHCGIADKEQSISPEKRVPISSLELLLNFKISPCIGFHFIQNIICFSFHLHPFLNIYSHN